LPSNRPRMLRIGRIGADLICANPLNPYHPAVYVRAQALWLPLPESVATNGSPPAGMRTTRRVTMLRAYSRRKDVLRQQHLSVSELHRLITCENSQQRLRRLSAAQQKRATTNSIAP